MNKFKYSEADNKLWLEMPLPDGEKWYEEKYNSRLSYDLSPELKAMLTDGQVLGENEFDKKMVRLARGSAYKLEGSDEIYKAEQDDKGYYYFIAIPLPEAKTVFGVSKSQAQRTVNFLTQEDQPLPDKEGYWVKAEDRLPEDMWQGKFRDVRDNSLKEYRGIHELDKGRFSKGSIIFPSRFVEYYVNAKPKEDNPERLFTLDEMLGSWEAGAEWYEDNEDKLRFGKRSTIQPKTKEQYFLETFGIDIKNNQP